MPRKRKSVAAYEVFAAATPADIIALGLVVVETDALGACPKWGRYRAAPIAGRATKAARSRTTQRKAATP